MILSNKNISNLSSLLLVFFLLQSRISYSQKTKIIDYFNKEYSTEIKIKKIDSILINKLVDSLPYNYHTYAVYLNKNNKLKKAIEMENVALSLYDKDNVAILESTYFLGTLYQKNKEYDKSIAKYDKVINLNKDKEYSINAYINLGKVYYKIHDYYNALKYFDLLFTISDLNKSQEVKYLTNCSIICSKIRGPHYIKRGIDYAIKADSLSNLYKSSKKTKLHVKKMLGILNNDPLNFNIKKSYKYYIQALDLAIQIKDYKQISIINLWLGNLYITTDQIKSISFLKNALSHTKDTNHMQLHKIYFNLSMAYAYKGELKKSIKTGINSINILLEKKYHDILLIDKTLILKLDLKTKKKLLIAIPNLGEVYLKYYEETKNHALLNKSIFLFKLADYITDLLKINSTEPNSKLFWRKISTDIYGKAIKACYLNNQINDAFYFMEKNKALLLMEDINTLNYRESLNIPKELLEKERSLKQKLFLLKDKKRNEYYKVDSLEKKEIDIEIELFTFQDSIYSNINVKEPEFRLLKDIKTVKNYDVLLEYHISIENKQSIFPNFENAYALFATKDKQHLFEIPNQNFLKEQVIQLISLMRQPLATKEDLILFNELSNTVYKKLFPTKKIRKLIKGKRIKIVTDSYLSYLPFESLVTKIDKKEYLIENCTVSYAYSFSFLKNNMQLEENNHKFIGFAPKYFKNENLLPLENSEKELESLKKYYTGKSFVEGNATKNKFLNSFKSYNIIHLATHANANDSINPWIAFNDDKLTLDELYINKSNASLVVLSGCNTTLGKEEVGEGVMSLARGFFFSGTQSVISSLWNVDDRATPEIMNSFYTNLHNGQTKAKALRNAKLSYLHNHSLSDASPHYWASFILLGKDDLIQGDYFPWYWLMLSVFIIITIVIYYKIFHR